MTRRPVLVVGHPGHELRVYGWMASTRPVVHVLTDGSGSGGRARTDSTAVVLDDVAAARGSVFGRMSDREIYSAILAGDYRRLLDLADEIAASVIEHDADIVAGDAVEGFNPSHDVCRYVINAAVRLASHTTGRSIACYAFPLEAAPHRCPDEHRAGALWVQLDEAMLGRKINAAKGYAELRSEVEATLNRFGIEPFRTECLWPANLGDRYAWDPDRTPYYETYGSQRIASGAYQRLVTFREHVGPLADALWYHSVGAA